MHGQIGKNYNFISVTRILALSYDYSATMYAPDIKICLLLTLPYITTLPSGYILYATNSSFSCAAIPIEATMGRKPPGTFAIIFPFVNETESV